MLLAPDGFHPLAIADIRRETNDSVSLSFDVPPKFASHFVFRAGQHVTLLADIDGEDVRRTYPCASRRTKASWASRSRRSRAGAFPHSRTRSPSSTRLTSCRRTAVSPECSIPSRAASILV